MSLLRKKREFYDFSAEDLDGNPVSMEKYKGMIVIITNSTSQGPARKHLGRLEALYEVYKNNGFAVLAFPCNEFGKGEKTSLDELKQLYYEENEVHFDVFAPVQVNGPAAHPLFRWLKKKKAGQFGKRIEWSFAKFLLSRDGKKIYRFTNWSSYDLIGKKIRKMLSIYGPTRTREQTDDSKEEPAIPEQQFHFQFQNYIERRNEKMFEDDEPPQTQVKNTSSATLLKPAFNDDEEF